MGRVLIAVTDGTIAQSLADALAQNGYLCETAESSERLAGKLSAGTYNALIADARMFGCRKAATICKALQATPALPLLLVLGPGSQPLSNEFARLPVLAYLAESVSHMDLLTWVQLAIEYNQTYMTMSRSCKRLEDWHRDLADLVKLIDSLGTRHPALSLDMFLMLTMKNVAGCLADLEALVRGTICNHDGSPACHLFECPRVLMLENAVRQTIQVLEESKGSFKSKRLGNLRRTLKPLLNSPPGPDQGSSP